ncbi:DUF7033 domain-containing protein [Thermoflavifilum thermophilum]|uniref:DUF7033 domain-containing protein n=1 Tax=Thermoflavifilum thermophilum TaxID=1393122 RepID=A0A1I7NB22_9BACT|nr:hypothetical protein [Thermoflavifilum thermophilum]SFV31831.1 hypothetical protein SAMN05660895_1188 [Thermoflavifilum thermophilum]
MQIHIFTSRLTARLQYVGKFILEQQMGLQVKWVLQPPVLISEAWINYTHASYADAFNITPHSLLFETDIKQQKIEFCSFDSLKAFFPCVSAADFPFDIFAATFYLLSRYEEYLYSEQDKHGRFPATASIAYQQKFLDEPIVHHWIQAFQQALSSKFPYLKFRLPVSRLIPTYDVDMAFAYRGKPLFRQIGAAVWDIWHRHFSEITLRWKVVINQTKDPYDVYEWLNGIHEFHHLQPIYFFPVGKYGRYDKQIAPTHPVYKKLIVSTSSNFTTGIHLSYASFLNERKIKREIGIFASVAGFQPKHNRFHYLRFRIPDSYRQLLSAGIQHDYSMGYATHVGFRAGVADAFFWYDLIAEKETALLIHPFCWMDTGVVQLKSSPDAYAEQVWRMWEKIHAAGGTCMLVLHPNYFSEYGRFCGYRQAYQHVVQQIMQRQ